MLFLTLGFAARTLWAAPEDYEGRYIKAIEFSPVAQPYSPEYLDQILPIKVNQPLRLADVRAAIARLYATGRYARIAVDASAAEGGVVLTFITSNNYFVGHVSVERVSQPPGEGVLVNATRLDLGTLYTEGNGKQAVRNIQDVLRNNGFYVTRVTPQFEYDPATQLVAIHFAVVSGPRARYRMPVIVGHPESPVEDVAGATHWKGWLGWKKVTEARTQDGVQRVRRTYEKQDRLEARVTLDKMDYDADTNRVTPTLGIEGGPKIKVEVAGANVSRGKLRQIIPVYEEQAVDRDLLVEGANNLTEYLEGEGYFDARVDFSTKTATPGEETIQYNVQRGERHRIALVAIEGNKYFDTSTIRERMYVRAASFPQLRHGRFSENLMRHDVETIAALYISNGFRDVRVTPRVAHGYKSQETSVAVYIRIEEGRQWRVAKLDLEDVSAENRDAVERLLESVPGQPFSELNVAADRDNVLDYYFNQGYPNASFQWSFSPAAEPHEVALKYLVEEGARRFVRSVLISGLNATKPQLVKERVMLQAGDPLSRARMLDTERRLYNAGVFARVDIALEDPDGEERNKNVLIDVEEARKYTVSTGVGAEFAKIGGCSTCLDAPAGANGFSPRVSFGLTRRNLFGDGHVLSFQSLASSLEQRAVLSYELPQFQGNPNLSLLFSTLFDDSKDVRTFSAMREEGSVQLGQKISKASTMLYRFSYRNVRVDRATLKISPELIPLLSQPVRIGIFAASYIQDRRDDPVDSHRGIYNTLDLGWASHTFGSQSDFVHFLGHNATYYPFGLGSRYVLARSITFGWLQNLRNGTQVPLPERFFAGGAESDRAFPENQAGPRDLVTGFPLGGNAVLLNQVEFRYPLVGGNLRGVLFWDAGNVYSSLDKVSFRVRQQGLQDFNYMVHAVGWGVRYRTPIGPVRLDLAYSINPPRFFGFKGTLDQLLFGTGQQTIQQISHFQFHFSLGQAF